MHHYCSSNHCGHSSVLCLPSLVAGVVATHVWHLSLGSTLEPSYSWSNQAIRHVPCICNHSCGMITVIVCLYPWRVKVADIIHRFSFSSHLWQCFCTGLLFLFRTLEIVVLAVPNICARSVIDFPFFLRFVMLYFSPTDRALLNVYPFWQ